MIAYGLNRVFAVAALALAGLLMIVGVASAQPGYAEEPGVSVSSTSADGDVTATGTGFGSGEPVDGTVFSDPIDLGTKNADSSGTVSFSFNVYELGLEPGEHTIVMSAASQTVSSTFLVPGGGAGAGNADVAQVGTGSSSDGGLAFTGSDAIIPLSIVGVLLLVGGGLALVGSRRSRNRDRV